MSEQFVDRLMAAVISKNSSCVVNVDPVIERIPESIGADQASASPLDRIVLFSRRVIHIVAPLVPVVKLNIAYFECYGGTGLQAYFDLVAEASERGLIVIGDVKRGDVGHTAKMYATAQLSRHTPASSAAKAALDAITVNGYFGLDGVKPFMEVARSEGRGLFVLVRTSNPSAADIQDVVAADGRAVHEIVAAEVAEWADMSGTTGKHGYSSVGAVVASRDAEAAGRLRALMPHSIFLVPGYGAQGGSAAEFKPYFKEDGTGALVAAGRSVIFAQENSDLRGRFGDDWESCVEHACKAMIEDLGRTAPLRPTP